MNHKFLYETKLNKAHKWFCRVMWCLWIICIVVLLVGAALLPRDASVHYTVHNAWDMFMDLLLSFSGALVYFPFLIPIEPVLFISSIVSSVRWRAGARAYVTDILRFLLCLVLWYILLCVFYNIRDFYYGFSWTVTFS